MNKVFLLYSNFSDYCKKLIPLVPIDINTLCIDNPKIRSKIIKSKQFNIKIVPTIIIINNNNNIIYEGQDATNFVNSLVQDYTNTKEDEIIIKENEEDKTIGRTSISDLLDLGDDNDNEMVGKTSISNLLDLEDDNETEEEEEETLMEKVERMKTSREND